MPLQEVRLDRISSTLRLSQLGAVEPAQILLDAPAAMKTTGYEHVVFHGDPDGTEVQGLLVITWGGNS